MALIGQVAEPLVAVNTAPAAGIASQFTVILAGGFTKAGMGIGLTVTVCVWLIVRLHWSVNVQVYVMTPPHISAVPDCTGVAVALIGHTAEPLVTVNTVPAAGI